MKPNFLIIGAGFSGAVLARQLVETIECYVEIWDERHHVAGNCHTERDPKTKVMLHKYGPHIFNTNNDRVWEYINRFGDFRPFINRVKAHTNRGMFSLPINLLTINQFFGRTMNPDEAKAFLASIGDSSIVEPQNFEEQAIKTLGHDLYETFFKGYTIKQWGCHPRNLPASILKRLPVRFDYNDNYYDKKYQGIPAEGYTEVVHRILRHPNIHLRLGKKFEPASIPYLPPSISHVFYTGTIDTFFNYSKGRLSYRTVVFDRIETDSDDYQGAAIINYPDQNIPYTRIHEHKHFAPWEKTTGTAVFREFSKETQPGDTPYYPKRLSADLTLLKEYRKLAELSQSPKGFPVSFLGRLATYRYMDMETVIGEALDFSDQLLLAHKNYTTPPVFPNIET